MSWRDEPGDVPPSFNPDDHTITDYDLPYKAYHLILDDYEPSDFDLNFVLIALCEAIGGAPEGDFDLIAGAGGHEYLAYKAATANLSSEEEGEAFKGYQEAWATTRSRNVTVRFLTMVNRSIEELVSCGLVEIVEIDGHPCYRVPGHPRLMAKLAANDDSPWGERGREVWGKRAARLGELRHMPYDEYLQTEEWATRRARHLAWALSVSGLQRRPGGRRNPSGPSPIVRAPGDGAGQRPDYAVPRLSPLSPRQLARSVSGRQVDDRSAANAPATFSPVGKEGTMSWRDEVDDVVGKAQAATDDRARDAARRQERIEANRQEAERTLRGPIREGVNQVFAAIMPKGLGGDISEIRGTSRAGRPEGIACAVTLRRPAGRDPLTFDIIADYRSPEIAYYLYGPIGSEAFPKTADAVTPDAVAAAIWTAYRFHVEH